MRNEVYLTSTALECKLDVALEFEFLLGNNASQGVENDLAKWITIV